MGSPQFIRGRLWGLIFPNDQGPSALTASALANQLFDFAGNLANHCFMDKRNHQSCTNLGRSADSGCGVRSVKCGFSEEKSKIEMLKPIRELTFCDR
ncbi:MAG: hypothetical protein RLZZ511_853 [Cyanobacteriota bacterium]|jgi:hypothetical protein